MDKDSERYAPARRLQDVREALESTGGLSVYEISERFGVSVRTAIRYLRSLEASGVPLYDHADGKKKSWRIAPTAHPEAITFTVGQMVALSLSRRVFDFLTGTGLKEDLDDMFDKVAATLRAKKNAAARNIDRKLYDVNEAPHIYDDRVEHVDDMVTALLNEEKLRAAHSSVARGQKQFELEPYTLLVYKKGLYLVAFSHHHKGIRSFSLDGFREIEWLKGQKFVYPADYHPAQLLEGAFGLISGPRTRVRIRFAEKVARYVQRRRWHLTQEFKRVPGGIELSMDVAGTVELHSWVLGFGDQAEVLEPEQLREEILAELRQAVGRYSR